MNGEAYLSQPIIIQITNPVTVEMICMYTCRNRKCGKPFQPDENTEFPRCDHCNHKAALKNLPLTKQCMVIIEMQDEEVEHVLPFDVIQGLPVFQDMESPTNDDIENYILTLSDCTMDIDADRNVITAIILNAQIQPGDHANQDDE